MVDKAEDKYWNNSGYAMRLLEGFTFSRSSKIPLRVDVRVVEVVSDDREIMAIHYQTTI